MVVHWQWDGEPNTIFKYGDGDSKKGTEKHSFVALSPLKQKKKKSVRFYDLIDEFSENLPSKKLKPSYCALPNLSFMKVDKPSLKTSTNHRLTSNEKSPMGTTGKNLSGLKKSIARVRLPMTPQTYVQNFEGNSKALSGNHQFNYNIGQILFYTK